jgi:hypothetical protein
MYPQNPKPLVTFTHHAEKYKPEASRPNLAKLLDTVEGAESPLSPKTTTQPIASARKHATKDQTMSTSPQLSIESSQSLTRYFPRSSMTQAWMNEIVVSLLCC